MVLSITVCTYNRVEFLKNCLKSILDQTQGSPIIEINIIDNNSSDKTFVIIDNADDLNFNSHNQSLNIHSRSKNH